MDDSNKKKFDDNIETTSTTFDIIDPQNTTNTTSSTLKNKRFRKLLFLSTIILLALLLITTTGKGKYNSTSAYLDKLFKFNSKNYYIKNVKTKYALSTTPYTPKDVSHYALTPEAYSREKFHKYHMKGYITDLQEGPIDNVFFGLNVDSDYNLIDKYCKQYEYSDKIEYSFPNDVNKKNDDDDFLEARRDIIEHWPKYQKYFVDEAKEVSMSELDIVQQKWFKFGTSAVWLSDEQCYLSVTRYMYAPEGNLKRVKISLGRLQLFDKNWNEIKGRRLYYKDLLMSTDDGFANIFKESDNKIESIVEQSLKEIDAELGIKECTQQESAPIEYDNCIDEMNKLRLISQKRKEDFLNKYSVKFPTFMDIELGSDSGLYLGSEDPRIVLKQQPVKEPYIIFNMVQKDGNRYIHGYYPLRKFDKQVTFTIGGRSPNRMEKNWTPFFHLEDETKSNTMYKGFIRFVYSYRPLQILKCSLLDGDCQLVYDGNLLLNVDDNNVEHYEKNDFNKLDNMRGGSQLINLNSILPIKVEYKNLWAGFAKLHLKDCGCGERYYRPVLIVMSEHNGIYNEEMIVPVVDFDMDVLGWDRKTTKCGGYNVLNPNSITSWEIQQDGEDILQLLISEADFISRRIILKNVLKYIMSAYSRHLIREDYQIDGTSKQLLQQSLYCIIREGKSKCKSYGESHKD
ncbi:uncharacterized protein SCODWIG_03759 [Saccharomycodes ludwigii]|uniref:Beta-mannosyltransferase 1 n=1 Tax=Saccharomycodes ludwigii TaxID=36035 RepID=A0A376BBD0_9ASCO|nr:uncharacterized protein SCODWIG_03759 [Saccharomycodes ludwigii]